MHTAVTLVAGLALSALICLLMHRANDQGVAAQFRQRAGNRSRVLRKGIQEQLEALRSLHDLYNSSQQVEPAEFRRFADGLLRRHRGIELLLWIQRSPPDAPLSAEGTGERIRMRITFLRPRDAQGDAVGVDLWADPVCRATMQRARRAGESRLASSDAVARRLGAGFENLVLLPFARPDSPGAPPTLHGFVGAGFRLDHLLRSLHEDLDMGGMDVFVQWHAAAEEVRVVYERNGRVLLGARAAERADARAGLHSTYTLELAGEPLEIACRPTRSFLRQQGPWAAWLALGTGVVITGLLAAYVWFFMGRAQRNQQLAAEQQRINRALEQQMLDRRRAEAALHESQRTLATLMSNLPGMAYRCANDPDWTMEFVSEGSIALTGYRPEELIDNAQTSFGQIIFPEDRPMVWETVQEALETRRPYQMTYRIQTRDEKIKWVWEQGQGVYGADGELLALEGFINNITERLAAEQALRRERDYAHSLVDTAQAIVLVLGEDATIREINRYGQALLGYASSELIGKNWFRTFLPPEDQEHQMAVFRQGVIDGSPRGGESPVITRDGRRIFVSWTATMLYDPETNATGVLAIGMDVTEQRRLLEQATSDAELRKVLLSELNHRVKNNLATISSLLYIERTRPTQKKNVFIESCLRRVESLSELHAILSERISETVSVYTLIHRVTSATVSGSPPPHPEVLIETPGESPRVPADTASGLAMAASELIANALRHGLGQVDSPRLRVSVHAADSLCTLEVADNGPGLPDGFDIKRDAGTGLNLVWYIAQKQLNGTVEFTRDAGEARATLTFPCPPEAERPPTG